MFQDTNLFHAELIQHVCVQAYTMPASMRGVGGKKIRDAETWQLLSARLLTWRALYLFCLTNRVSSAYVADRWVNVMVDGDYSTPHCHFESQGAVVYSLDTGDPNPADPMDGDFEIIDSRIPACCPHEPERPNRGIAPKLRPGMMILFPSEFLHHVRPYSGRRPRLTIAWNICPGPPPANPAVDPTKQMPFKISTT